MCSFIVFILMRVVLLKRKFTFVYSDKWRLTHLNRQKG
ncbi:hypothetical protein P20652_1714 [Pseudoalteromonas sp. BSi20652]|nr:hypothetical protein P20652_1714 [Pseudoalteromonas sp. BSi20652]